MPEGRRRGVRHGRREERCWRVLDSGPLTRQYFTGVSSFAANHHASPTKRRLHGGRLRRRLVSKRCRRAFGRSVEREGEGKGCRQEETRQGEEQGQRGALAECFLPSSTTLTRRTATICLGGIVYSLLGYRPGGRGRESARRR